MERQKCLPTEVKARKHQERKRIKLALAESAANSENNSADNSEVDSPRPSQPAQMTREPPIISQTTTAALGAEDSPSTVTKDAEASTSEAPSSDKA